MKFKIKVNLKELKSKYQMQIKKVGRLKKRFFARIIRTNTACHVGKYR